jgi:hypothetical protein
MSSSKLSSYIQSHLVPVITGWDGEFYAIDHHHLTRAVLDSNLSKDDKVLYAQIVADFSDTTELEFWSKMIEKGYTWLFDERGSQPVSPFHLADDMYGLANDFYRSLAYFVRLGGGFAKTDTAFAEFVWANWFRTQLPLPWPSPTQQLSSSSTCSLSGLATAEAPKRNLGSSLGLEIPKVIEGPATLKWNVCDVLPYEPPCLQHESSVLIKMLPTAIQLAMSPAAYRLPGYGQGQAEDPHCDLAGITQRLTLGHPRTTRKSLGSGFKRPISSH